MKTNITFTLLVTSLTSLALSNVRAGDTILHTFYNGDPAGAYGPEGSLTLSGSKVYGMTQQGGIGAEPRGTVFVMNTDGTGFSVLHSFNPSSTDGGLPSFGSLTLSASKLYGMTPNGGSAGKGVLFNMNTDGTGFSLLHSFTGSASDGGNPYDSLTLSGSKLYGMTRLGGGAGGNGTLYNGTLFSINTDGTGFSLLHSFSGTATDGGQPYGTPILFGSKLYGMTSLGGSGTAGTIFSMNTDGSSFALLHSFAGGVNDGSSPIGSLSLSGSTLYGMTNGMSNQSGTGDGTVFSINADGSSYTTLYSFAGGTDGANPQGNVTLSADAQTLYGMTLNGGGGISAGGVIFSLPSTVPEPSTWAMLAAGTASLVALRRRNSKNQDQ